MVVRDVRCTVLVCAVRGYSMTAGRALDFAPDSPRRGPHVIYVRTRHPMADADHAD
ncbi:MAG: hypothetical protein ACRDTG_11105 [Pseudonocardiaceae bacterium]